MLIIKCLAGDRICLFCLPAMRGYFFVSSNFRCLRYHALCDRGGYDCVLLCNSVGGRMWICVFAEKSKFNGNNAVLKENVYFRLESRYENVHNERKSRHENVLVCIDERSKQDFNHGLMRLLASLLL